jgi:hypothetical protein
MSSTDEQMAERRRKNFAIRAEPMREPDFDGEKLIHYTYNGSREYAMQLAPHEARKLYDLLGAEFGLGQAADCLMCNNSGIVGSPPDNYYDCPDCVAARAVQQAPDAARDAGLEVAAQLLETASLERGEDTGNLDQEDILFFEFTEKFAGLIRAKKSQPALKLAEDGKGE